MVAVCLSIPHWIYSVTEKSKDCLSQLEPGESSISVTFCLISSPRSYVRKTKPERYVQKLIYNTSLMQKLGSHHLTNRLMK